MPKAHINGATKKASFISTQIGSNLNDGSREISYSLATPANDFSNAVFGNASFEHFSRAQTKGTDWKTVSVVGNINADKKASDILYPLFSQASNMDDTDTPPKWADKRAKAVLKFGI